MNLRNGVKLQHNINVILSTAGLIGSLYILGWVPHENHVIIGFSCFILFLILLIGTTLNYTNVLGKIEKQNSCEIESNDTKDDS